MNQSDPKRMVQVMAQIAQVKDKLHPLVRAVEGTRDRMHEIVPRAWKDVPESGKLAMLNDLDWEGITNRDRAHLMLRELDVGKLSDHERNWLIETAEPKAERRKTAAKARDMDMEK